MKNGGISVSRNVGGSSPPLHVRFPLLLVRVFSIFYADF